MQLGPTHHVCVDGASNAITFSYTVNTMPPLKTSLPNLIVLPRQNPRTPELRNMSRIVPIVLTLPTVEAPCD
jgi:hypothetical protein